MAATLVCVAQRIAPGESGECPPWDRVKKLAPAMRQGNALHTSKCCGGPALTG